MGDPFFDPVGEYDPSRRDKMDAIRQNARELALLLSEAQREWGVPWERPTKYDDARHIHIDNALWRYRRLHNE